MPNWVPEPLWEGADAIIIGGGPSLKGFNWDLLKDEMTIGCNAAYTLGKEVCSVILFGDSSFFKDHQVGLENYGGPVFTNSRRLLGTKIPWLLTIPRQSKGLSHTALGWNGCTGAGAVNLAFLFGAKRVYLLGFDMMVQYKVEGQPLTENWHTLYDKKKARKNPLKKGGSPYPRFLSGFEDVVKDWKEKFSDREIINVNDDTALRCFPVMSVSEFLKERANGC